MRDLASTAELPIPSLTMLSVLPTLFLGFARPPGLASPAAGSLVRPRMQAGLGFGSPPPPPPPLGAVKGGADKFTVWAMSVGVQRRERISIGEFDGERGVVAEAEIAAGARVLSVPSKLALQTTTGEKCPEWCSPNAWGSAKWDARLAMRLLHEVDGRDEPALKPWYSQLPASFATPVTWSDPAAAFDAVGYPSLGATVAAQAAEWEVARVRAPGAPTAERWAWAMNTVRSRAFSGPYTGSTFVRALVQLFGGATLALGYTLLSGNEDLGLNAFLGFAIYVALNDLFFGPRVSKAKRYVLCPWVDLLNHDGKLGGSEVKTSSTD